MSCQDLETKEQQLPFAQIIEFYKKVKSAQFQLLENFSIHFFNNFLNISKEKVTQVEETLRLFAIGATLIDDVMDESKFRHGIPAVQAIYGRSNAVHSIFYCTFINFKNLLKLNSIEVINEFIKMNIQARVAEGMDVYWRDHFCCPTEKEYYEVLCQKSFAPLQFVVAAVQPFCDENKDFSSFLHYTSILMTIYDDYINLNSEEYFQNKGFCNDITEGKFTFPIIHAIWNSSGSDKNQIIHILKQRTENGQLKQYFRELLKRCGSFEYTLKVMNDLEEKVKLEFKKHGASPAVLAMVDSIKAKMRTTTTF